MIFEWPSIPERREPIYRQVTSTESVLEFLQENPYRTAHQIAVAMKKTDTWVSSRLQNLEKKQLVTFEMRDSPKRNMQVRYWSAA